MAEAFKMIQDLLSKLSLKQVYSCFKQTVFPNKKSILKLTPVVAQNTTTNWSGITVVQQFRWFECYNSALDTLRHINEGVCNLTGKTFGEFIQNFVYGGDETWFQACGNGKSRVFVSHGKKKHEKKDSESRVSIKMYLTGSIDVCTGPTIFFLGGKSRHHHFTDKWLMDNGAAIGSTVAMTPTAFITEEAWEEPTPHIVKGLFNADPILAANTQWWMLVMFDGFGPHTSYLKSMQYRANNKIIPVKEEGDYYHCNQAYGKFAANSDKAAKKESLPMFFAEPRCVSTWMGLTSGV